MKSDKPFKMSFRDVCLVVALGIGAVLILCGFGLDKMLGKKGALYMNR